MDPRNLIRFVPAEGSDMPTSNPVDDPCATAAVPGGEPIIVRAGR